MEPEKRERDEPEPQPDTERTPGWLRSFVNQDFEVTFEPEKLQDPLSNAWEGFSFAHPPHAEAELWCIKAANEAEKNHFSVLLLPAVFNSCYWRDIVYKHATEIRVFACPIKMPNKKKQIVSQMCLIVFAGTENRPADFLEYPPIFPILPDDWASHYYKRPRNMKRFQ